MKRETQDIYKEQERQRERATENKYMQLDSLAI